jgi:hypothetical protein
MTLLSLVMARQVEFIDIWSSIPKATFKASCLCLTIESPCRVPSNDQRLRRVLADALVVRLRGIPTNIARASIAMCWFCSAPYAKRAKAPIGMVAIAAPHVVVIPRSNVHVQLVTMAGAICLMLCLVGGYRVQACINEIPDRSMLSLMAVRSFNSYLYTTPIVHMCVIDAHTRAMSRGCYPNASFFRPRALTTNNNNSQQC